jgi:hypothetical protein
MFYSTTVILHRKCPITRALTLEKICHSTTIVGLFYI